MRKVILLIMLTVGLSLYGRTDSLGVYSVGSDGAKRIEVLNYTATKVTTGFLSAKSKLEFSGATSTNSFEGSATFRLYFGVPSPYEAARYYMFTPSYSVRDFGVVRFEVKKGRRYLTTSRVSILGARSGGSDTPGLNIETKKIADNVYEITVSGAPGEYAIAAIINGMAGYAGVFDFTII